MLVIAFHNCQKGNELDKLKALHYFVEAVESGSFSAAAVRFKVPASSISRRISDLEAELGAQLINRSTRSLALTEVGQHYLANARDILERVKHSEQMVNRYQSKPEGVLKISALAGFGEQILLPILDQFVEIYPEVKLDVALTDQLSKLDKDDVDIAIRGGFAPDERIIAVRLMDNDFIPVASPEYLSVNGTPVVPEDLIKHKGLFYKTPKGPTPWLTMREGQVHDVSGIKTAVINNGRYLVQKAVKGEGIVFLPKWELIPWLQNGALVELIFDRPVKVVFGHDLAIFMLYQKFGYTVPKIKAAVDFIIEKIRDRPLE